jgi:hypothetical protein
MKRICEPGLRAAKLDARISRGEKMVHQAGFEPTTPAFGVLKVDV